MLRRTRQAILIRVWGPAATELEPVAQRLIESGSFPGLFPLDDGLFGAVAEAGDPAVVEAAHHFSRQLAALLPRLPSILLMPGTLVEQDGGARPEPGPLLDDLMQRPAPFGAGVLLTGHAVSELEGRFAVDESGVMHTASGRQVPLVQLGTVRPTERPWRNPELLGRRVDLVERPELLRLVKILHSANEPLVVVSGGLGSGKTRLVWEAARRAGTDLLWATCWSARSGGPTLARQMQFALSSADPVAAPFWESRRDAKASNERLLELLARSRSRSRTLVCDGVEGASSDDLTFLQALVEHPGLGTTFRLVFLTRPGQRRTPAPSLELAHLSGPTEDAFQRELFAGLDVPDSLQERFVAAAGGVPFALEEGAAQLIRRRGFRRLYGSFFFSGDEQTDYQPSPRLVRHLDAELLRLGSAGPPWILATAGTALPADVLAQAAAILELPARSQWQEDHLEARLLRPSASPWGAAVVFSCDAWAVCAADSLGGAAETTKHTVGRILASRPQRGRASWQTYRLLAGTAAALPPLLVAAREPASGAARHELLAALAEELEAHRRRDGDERSELELLWIALPLAHRLGRLRGFRSALDRAIDLARDQPSRLMALSALKAEQDQNEGRLDEAERSLRQALSLARGADERRKAMLVVQLGRLLQRRERYPEARRLFEQLLELLERSGSASLKATAHYHLGNIALRENRLDKALGHHREALVERRRQRLPRQLGASLTAMGRVLLLRGDYLAALGHYREAVKVLGGRRRGRRGEVADALQGVGQALSLLGDVTGASVPYRRALNIRRDRDDLRGEALSRLLVAENHLALNQIGTGLEEARKALFQLRLAAAREAIGDAEQVLGRLELRRGSLDRAVDHLKRATEEHQAHGDITGATFDRAYLLEAELARDNTPQVERLCSELHGVLETLRYPERGEILDLRLHQGLCWLAQRQPIDIDAVEPLRRAYIELFRKTELLAPELRHRFLFQIPDNQAILEAGTHHGLDPKG